MEEFIKNFANEWDETELEFFNADCKFREIEEWSSLIGLALLNMIMKKYNVKLTPNELSKAETIAELYSIIQSKK